MGRCRRRHGHGAPLSSELIVASLIHHSSYLFLPSSIIALGHRCSHRRLFNRYCRRHAGTHAAAMRVHHGCKHALVAADFTGRP